ncbi:MAG: hypothetical protein GY799_18480 [Desulfobulbaceae bacterium]|nr:hypothetical protein [Desulfobulbaceae bacterium]
MKWEYKRLLFSDDIVLEGIHHRSEKKRYHRNGTIANPDIADPVEDNLNELGDYDGN